jgi:hypothetical protein
MRRTSWDARVAAHRCDHTGAMGRLLIYGYTARGAQFAPEPERMPEADHAAARDEGIVAAYHTGAYSYRKQTCSEGWPLSACADIAWTPHDRLRPGDGPHDSVLRCPAGG